MQNGKKLCFRHQIQAIKGRYVYHTSELPHVCLYIGTTVAIYDERPLPFPIICSGINESIDRRKHCDNYRYQNK